MSACSSLCWETQAHLQGLGFGNTLTWIPDRDKFYGAARRWDPITMTFGPWTYYPFSCHSRACEVRLSGRHITTSDWRNSRCRAPMRSRCST